MRLDLFTVGAVLSLVGLYLAVFSVFAPTPELVAVFCNVGLSGFLFMLVGVVVMLYANRDNLA